MHSKNCYTNLPDCMPKGEERVAASHTHWTVSLQTKHAHLRAVHLGTRGQWLVSSESQTSEVAPQFPLHSSCLAFLTALSSPSCEILPVVINLQKPEERLGYLG